MESRSLSIAGFLSGLLLTCYGVVQTSIGAAVIGCVVCWVAGRLYRS